MNLEKMLKDAYMSGVTECQVASEVPNMSFDFDGMANAYAQSKVKKLNIPDVVLLCPFCESENIDITEAVLRCVCDHCGKSFV